MRIAVVVLIVALLAGGALVLARQSSAPEPEPQPASRSSAGDPPSTPPVATGPKRGGRVIDVDVALKSLELIKPVKIKAVGDFTLPMPDGKTFRLSEHHGKMVFLNFWATWCEPCKEEMPAMERLWRSHQGQGFVMVGVSLDSNPKVVPPFIAQPRLTFHIAVTPKMFVLGFSLVFVGLGASFSAVGQFLLDYRDPIRLVGGALIVIFGLYIAGVFRLGIFGRTAQWQISEKPAGYLGTLLVGVTFAIGWTPCVGPILGAILSLAGTAETVSRGVGLLVAYSAGLGLPFLLSAIALGSFLKFFKRYRPFIPTVERAAGVLLVVVGVLVITNKYILLNAWAISLTPEWLLKRL